MENVENMLGHKIDVYCVDEENQKYGAKILYGNGYYEIFGCFPDKNELFLIFFNIFFKNL